MTGILAVGLVLWCAVFGSMMLGFFSFFGAAAATAPRLAGRRVRDDASGTSRQGRAVRDEPNGGGRPRRG